LQWLCRVVVARQHFVREMKVQVCDLSHKRNKTTAALSLLLSDPIIRLAVVAAGVGRHEEGEAAEVGPASHAQP
jgi:hypothetical protein